MILVFAWLALDCCGGFVYLIGFVGVWFGCLLVSVWLGDFVVWILT